MACFVRFYDPLDFRGKLENTCSEFPSARDVGSIQGHVRQPSRLRFAHQVPYAGFKHYHTNHILHRQVHFRQFENGTTYPGSNNKDIQRKETEKMNNQRKKIILVITMLTMLLPLTAQAASYTWTGTTSGDWATSGNWNVSGVPSTYSDQATIPYLTTRPTVTLNTTELLGGGGTALTISTKSTTGTVNALTIGNGGTLGLQGGIISAPGGRSRLTREVFSGMMPPVRQQPIASPAALPF